MRNFFRALEKNWKIITTIFAIVAAGITMGIRIAHRVDTTQETLRSLQDDQDKWLDSLERRVTILEEDERLREKGICK